jgi:hypothetical protein
MTRQAYHRAIFLLRERPGITIDSDLVRPRGRNRAIASHQLAR